MCSQITLASLHVYILHAGNMHVSCIMHGTCMKYYAYRYAYISIHFYAWNMYWNTYCLCMKHAWNCHDPCLKHAWFMPETCMIHVWFMLQPMHVSCMEVACSMHENLACMLHACNLPVKRPKSLHVTVMSQVSCMIHAWIYKLFYIESKNFMHEIF